MSSHRVVSILVMMCAFMPGLAMFLGAVPATAQSSSANYAFLVASGFLCDSGGSATCPAVVKSANGDSYEMSGAGTFSSESKLVTAAGTFTHKSADGVVLETGVWTASELVSFDSYAIVPGALMREGRALGPPQLGPIRLRMFSGPLAAGGLAVFRVRLLPMRGRPRIAMLQVNCALGKVPPERPVEGIRLAFEGGSVEFNEEAGGRALFLLTRSGASAAVKAPAPEPDINPAPTEVQQ